MPARIAPKSVHVDNRDNGDIVLTSGHALPEPARCVGDWLVEWARRAPDRVFLAERDTKGTLPWRSLTYADALDRVERLASSWLRLGLNESKPLLILVDNGVDHALAALAAMHAGIPVAPASTAYALASSDFARLRTVASQLAPGAIVVGERARYARAIEALASVVPDARVLALDAVRALAEGDASDEMRDAFASIGPDTIAKVLFTSGSTGAPKGVLNTQRMLTSNQAAISALWPFLEDAPPVTVDWLPWSHTFGGNHNFHMILRNGGTLYVDEGRPAPALVDKTAKNLADVSPTIYFNVPRGFDLLLPALEDDDALRANFFAKLEVLFYAAAALPPSTRARLEAVANQAGRDDVFITSAWGSTETAPLATSAHYATSTPAIIGLPAPGTSIKLAAPDASGRRELRVRGPNVTTGYWPNEPARRDDDGFLPTGDAGALVDEGIVFQGRIGENFKLSSGTWVMVGQLRIALLDVCAPLAQDAVIAGHDRDALGVLIFPSPALKSRADLAARIALHNAKHASSSHRIARALVLAEPASIDAGEITDKGYINQRRVLENRAALVERLFAPAADPDVLVF